MSEHDECPICGRVLGTSTVDGKVVPSCDQCGPIDYDEVIDAIVTSVTGSMVGPTQTIYFDPVDHDMDGNGWNVVDGGAIAARFATKDEAVAWCDYSDLPYHLLPEDGSVNVQVWLTKPLWESAIRAMRNLANASADLGDEALTSMLDDMYDKLTEAHDTLFGVTE